MSFSNSQQQELNAIEPVVPEVPTSPTDASKSAGLFVTRIATQVASARIAAQGIAAIVTQQTGFVFDDVVVGWVTIGIAVLIIFLSQFGYQIFEKFGWTWAANLKWPF